MSNEERVHCGLVMPISAVDGYTAAHWEEVRDIIKESLPAEGYLVELVSHSDEISIIQNKIVNNLYNADIVICDVSAKNPNVMFELGMRLAFDKPVIIIKDSETNYIFDTSPIEHLSYPRDLHYASIVQFKLELKNKVEATRNHHKNGTLQTFLSNFAEFKVATLETKEVPQSEYILKALQNLESQVNKLTSLSLRTERQISADEIRGAINESFKLYCKTHNIKDYDIDNHRDDVYKFTLDYVSKMLGINKERCQGYIQTYFDSLLSLHAVPF